MKTTHGNSVKVAQFRRKTADLATLAYLLLHSLLNILVTTIYIIITNLNVYIANLYIMYIILIYLLLYILKHVLDYYKTKILSELFYEKNINNLCFIYSFGDMFCSLIWLLLFRFPV